jgi:PAS domain S-box-containing protein
MLPFLLPFSGEELCFGQPESGFYAEITHVNERIVLLKLQGIFKPEFSKNIEQLCLKIMNTENSGGFSSTSFSVIIDAKNLTEVKRSARIKFFSFLKYHSGAGRIQSISFISPNYQLKLASWFAQRSNSEFNFTIHANYKEAFTYVLNKVDEFILPTHEYFHQQHLLNEKQYEHLKVFYNAQIESITPEGAELSIDNKPEWNYSRDNDDFKCQFYVINGIVLLCQIKGELHASDITQFKICRQLATDSLNVTRYYSITDISHLHALSRKARKLFDELNPLDNNRLLANYWVQNGFIQSVFKIYQTIFPGKISKVEVCQSLKSALKLIFDEHLSYKNKRKDHVLAEEIYDENESPEIQLIKLRKELEQTKQSHNQQINTLLNFVGRMAWEDHIQLNIPTNLLKDDFLPVIHGFQLVQHDVSSIMRRSREMNINLEKAVNERTEKIKATESNLRAILDNTDDEIYLVNEHYELIDYNTNFQDNFYARFGVDVKKGGHLLNLFPEEYKDLGKSLKDRLDKALQGMPRTYHDRFKIGLYESIVEVNLFPIRSSKGNIIGVSVYSRDCTEQKRSEGIIRENQNLLSSINRNIKEGLYRSTPNKGIIYVNQAFIEMFGYATEEEAIRGFSSKMYANSNRRAELVQRIEEHGSITNEEVEFIKKDGTQFVCLLSSMRTVNEDGTVYYDGALRDITPIKEIEKEILRSKEIAENATRAKSDFLATMSHEIRTPMNGVIGMTSLLADTPLNEIQKDYLETIRFSGEHLLNIINDILDFSKIEAGHLELENTAFDVNSCIEEVMNLFSSRAYEKNIELFYKNDSNKKLFVVGDVTRLRQVIVNLLGNAVKFTDKGEVVMGIQILKETESHLHLNFTVQDTGIGIASNKRDRLFKAFSQLDNTTTRKYGGTGLGLTISGKLVNLMGGDIQVESELNKGSQFSFNLEFKKADLEKEMTSIDFSILKGKKVLIIDDNQTNRKILSQLFLKYEIEVETYNNPLVALGILQQGKQFDLGLIDMKMPQMDGMEFGKAIKDLKLTNEIPLILYSSIGHMLSRTDIKKYFAEHVSKPIRHELLLERMSKVLAMQNETILVNQSVVQANSTKSLLTAELYPLNILVAEDNPINQLLAIRMLEVHGYKADLAHNGKEAFEAYKNKKYDLIFMDVQMPEMDGLSCTKAIREESNYPNKPFIVAMTANALKGDREMCIEAGMNDYLSKPVKSEEIKFVLEKYGKMVNAG